MGGVAQVVDGTVPGEPGAGGTQSHQPSGRSGRRRRTSCMSSCGRRGRKVYTASLDVTGQAAPSTPAPISAAESGHHLAPSWSPDGQSIAYFTARPSEASGREDSVALTIQKISRQARRGRCDRSWSILRPSAPQWLPGGERLLVFGGDQPSEDRLGYYEVDIQTANVWPIMLGITELSKIATR